MKKNVTIGILAHVDAGKTTLSEGLLYLAGAIRNMGRVDHRDTFLDTFELERSRGITIFSKQAVFDYKDISFTLLDTPGHSDFSPEMERTLQVLDLAVLIVSAPDGVTGQVKLLWKLLDHYGVPTVLFVNKMDQSGMNEPGRRQELTSLLKDNLSGHVVDFSRGLLDAAVQEDLAVCDDTLLSEFFDGRRISFEDASELTFGRKAYPCLFGSALKMEGVKELMDLITDLFAARKGDFQNTDTYGSGVPGAKKTPTFSARVFKISRDPQGKRLTHIKVTSGTIKPRDIVGDEKIDQIRLYSGEKFTPLQEATSGMICALTGLTTTTAGEGLGSLAGTTVSEVLQPILSSTLILPDDCDPHVLYEKLKSLEEEEPMLSISYNNSAKVIEVHIMGQVQEEILKHLIKTRFGIDVSFGPGHVVYKETIANTVEGVGHFEPLRHYAEVHLLMEPGEPGSGLVFDADCSTDDLALNWQRLILTHLAEKNHPGVLTGSDITDMKITLIAGRAHEKHTEGGDFRQATYRAVRQGLMTADSVLLEPYFEFTLEVPTDFVGRALSDLQRMNAEAAISQSQGDISVVTGTVPVASLGDYAKELSAYSKGQGRLTTTLKGYGPCHNAEEVIMQKAYDPDADLDNPASSVFCSHGAGTLIPWDQVKDYMHIHTSFDKKGSDAKTDLIDSIDIEELKKIQLRERKARASEMSFAEVQRDLRATENELKAIFERTYGTIKKRTVSEEQVYTAEDKEDKRDLSVEAEKEEKYKKNTGISEEKKEYLLVDGYNVIYANSELSSLASHDLKAARDSLVDTLCNFQGFRREHVILVFDAYRVPGGKEHLERIGGLDIIYTKEAETADQYIEKAAHEIGKKHKVTVATSDAIEQVIVMSSGAIRLSSRDFWEEIKRTKELINEKING